MKRQPERQMIRKVWAEMRRRCNLPAHKQYPDYGARGILVCPEWHKFEQFAEDMGPRPAGGMLERSDNNKGYGPGNCRWATRKEQNSNRRNCIYVQYAGERVTLKEFCRRIGLKYRPIANRISALGWSVEKAISTPIKKAGNPNGFTGPRAEYSRMAR